MPSARSLGFLFLLLFVGCTKTEENALLPVAETPSPQPAAYRVVLTGKWMSPAHTVPASDHFTKFAGLVHGSAAFMFHNGTIASAGMKRIAETGNDITINPELDAMIATGSASAKFNMNLATITASDEVVLNLTAKHSRVSFASMIAPSPDWFAGLDGYDLLQNGKWVDDVTVSVFGYDAGTENGDVFGYNNPATTPQQPVSSMTPANASVIANGNSSIAHFATVRFIRQ